MNNKGFTLTELIVTIALVSVIMGISLPAITKLQTENKKLVYETYEKALKTGAELYVDKFSRDLWKKEDNDTCIIIRYSDLICEDLIKKYNGGKGETVIDSTSDPESTAVYATKNGSNITYQIQLKIKNKSNQIIYNSKKARTGCKNPISYLCS